MSDESKLRDVAEAVKSVCEAVPVYQDAIQPAAQELGKSLLTVGKAVNAALSPLKVLIWGYDRIEDFVINRVAEKLRSVPPGDIRTPEPHVACPALEALRFTGHEETLREMYANLLANSLDARTAEIAHPAFVDIVKSMSPDEARIMQIFTT